MLFVGLAEKGDEPLENPKLVHNLFLLQMLLDLGVFLGQQLVEGKE